MKNRINTVKALSLLLMLILVLADIPLTVNASSHAGQPVNNIVTLRIINNEYSLIYHDLSISTTNNYPIPAGYYLVVTDISVRLKTKNVANEHNMDFSIQLAKPDFFPQKVFEKMISLKKNDNGKCIGDAEEHYNTGFAIPSSCDIRIFQAPPYESTAYLRGYLVQDGTNANVPVSNQPAPNTQTALTPATTQALEPDPWYGKWNTSHEGIGLVELTQNGSKVTGTIGDGKFLFSGTVSGKELTGVFQEPDTKFNGNISFTISDDGKSLTGKWNSSLSQTWQSITGVKQ